MTSGNQSAGNQSISKRRILLVGGNEFGAAGQVVNGRLLALTGVAPPRVAIIPTAAALENPQLAANNGVHHFNSLGAKTSSIGVLRESNANDPELAGQVADANVIYFTGGNPEYLLATLAGSAFLEAVIDAVDGGAILAGSSAGAMVLGEKMRRSPEQGATMQALGLLPGVMVLPHHEGSDPEMVASELAGGDTVGLTVLGIDGATGALLEPGRATVLGGGNVTVYRAGEWQSYSSEAIIPGLSAAGA